MGEDTIETPQESLQDSKQQSELEEERRRGTDALVDPNIPKVQSLLEKYISTEKNLPDIEIPYERKEFWSLLSQELENLRQDYKETGEITDDSNFKHLPTALRLVNKDIRHRQDLQEAETRYHLDALTGAYSQAYYKDELPQEITKDLEKNIPVAVFKIDVDNFKKVNDELGHEGGDLYLQQIVQFLKGNTRLNDKVLRSGGDEFDVYLKGISMETLMRIAERIHSKSQNMPFKFSIGISTNIGRTLDAKQLMREADVAAYNSKKDPQGNFLKNRYTIFTRGMVMPENGTIEDR